jgi:hypothetical protein
MMYWWRLMHLRLLMPLRRQHLRRRVLTERTQRRMRLAVLLSAVTSVSLTRKKWHPSRRDVLSLIAVGAVCACGAAVLVSTIAPAAPSSPTATVAEMSPTLGDPPTSVSCAQTFSGTASIPQGYVLVLGSRFVTSPIWTFIPVTQWQGNIWHSRVYMEQYQGSGRLADLEFAVIRTDSANYYRNSFQTASNGATWWDSTILPPGKIFSNTVLLELPPVSPNSSSCWRKT